MDLLRYVRTLKLTLISSRYVVLMVDEYPPDLEKRWR